MLSLFLTFQGTRLPVWEKFNSNVSAKCEYIFSDFCRLVSLQRKNLVDDTN